MSRGIAAIASWWQAEHDRHFLWLPVLFAAGIAAYYALPFEPSTGLMWGVLAAAMGVYTISFVGLKATRPLAIALVLMASGAVLAGLHTERQSPVVIGESLSPRPVRGVIEEIERTEHGLRITLGQVSIADIDKADTPQRIRLTVRPKKGTEIEWPHIGDKIWIVAGILPPMGPALPHGFDFARYFFFRDIGAVGFGLPPWHLVESRADDSLKARFMDWRFRLTDRIIETVGPRNGPIAAGLITGEARAISEDDFDALKASNLYHIIAISGGHMVVIAGVIYLGLRLLFLLLPGGLANKPVGKSAAAAITLLLTTLYLAVTGAPISAVRAYAMIVFLLLAVILARRVQPMRSLALAFWLMLLIDPSDLLEPGFQLSFAATLAIVALVEEAWFKHQGPPREDLGYRIRHLFVFALMISVVAELATMPLSIAMFNNFSLYGIIANLVATPLVSLFLMPVVALFFLLLPFGLESFALTLLDQGIRALLWIADTVSALPHAQMFLPSLPGWGVGLFVVGLCWFCIWERRPRTLGLPMMAIGFLSLFTVKLPDILISPNATQIAIRTENGYMQAKGRSNTMIAELWANGLGQKELLRKDKETVDCGDFGCIAPVGNTKLAFPTRKFSAEQACVKADIIIVPKARPITPSPIGGRGDGGGIRRGLTKNGPHPNLPPTGEGTSTACPTKTIIDAIGPLRALWLPDRLETSADWQGERPWAAKIVEEKNEE